MLWPTLPLDTRETLLSYADRLSMLHTGRGMERLVRDFGINLEHFVSGREEAVLAFAAMSGLHSGDALRGSIRVFQRAASFRGATSTKAFLQPQAKRYCPLCLFEDGGRSNWQCRLLWGFRHVHRCERHNVDLAPTSNTTANSLRVALDGHALAAPSPAIDEAPDYLTWLCGRLDQSSATEPDWLKEQTLEQVLAASEMLGGILQHGHKVKLTALSAAQAEEATDIGFSIFKEGPDAISEALDTIRQNSPATASQAGPLAHYGKLFDWLDRRCNAVDPGPIRDILRNHIVRNSAVEPGTILLGTEITERQFLTLETLSSEVGIERRRLARLLKSIGEIPATAKEKECGALLFEASSSVPLIEAFKTAIPMRDVPDYIGATKYQFDALYRAGILQPLVPRTGRGTVRNVTFGRTELGAFLSRIETLPAIDPSATDNLHSISYACQRGGGTYEEVFEAIFESRIAAYRNPEKHGLGSVLLDFRQLVTAKSAA